MNTLFSLYFGHSIKAARNKLTAEYLTVGGNHDWAQSTLTKQAQHINTGDAG